MIHHYPNTTFGISLPRINPAEGGYQPDHPLDDIHFVQFLTAYRIFQPKADVSVSTREVPKFRDHLLSLGVTRISAGSKTDVGGYTNQDASTAQFEISDARSVEETVAAIENKDSKSFIKIGRIYYEDRNCRLRRNRFQCCLSFNTKRDFRI